MAQSEEDASSEQGGQEDMPAQQLETIGEDDEEYCDESEESGFFDGFGDYDTWCAKQDGHVFDRDGYIVGSECDGDSDGYLELGGYPSEEEPELDEEISAKNRRALVKECGEKISAAQRCSHSETSTQRSTAKNPHRHATEMTHELRCGRK